MCFVYPFRHIGVLCSSLELKLAHLGNYLFFELKHAHLCESTVATKSIVLFFVLALVLTHNLGFEFLHRSPLT